MRKNPTNSRHIYTISSLFFFFFAYWLIFARTVLSSWDLFACFQGLFCCLFFFHSKETNEKKHHPSGQ